MHDKQIRRRRAVLVLLVAVSLILLTDYFGAPSSSPLHSVQRGLAEALAPVQQGASTVLSPVRDVAGWVSSTFKAKSQVANLKRENATLLSELAQANYNRHQLALDDQLLKLDDDSGLKPYDPVEANVIAKDLVVWYYSITIGQGTDAGVQVDDPVVASGGLVGDVSNVTKNQAIVTLLTSPKFSVGATIQNQANTQGLIQPSSVGDPTSLRLNDLPASAQVSTGEIVVTSGFVDQSEGFVHSLYPQGIPIGYVSSASPTASVQTSQTVDVTPEVDFVNLSEVQVLTKPDGGS